MILPTKAPQLDGDSSFVGFKCASCKKLLSLAEAPTHECKNNPMMCTIGFTFSCSCTVTSLPNIFYFY